MRAVERKQAQFGQIDIADITFDTRSRDDIPQVLKGLQHIYTTDSLRVAVFDLLEHRLESEPTQSDKGRPGMDLWKVFVLACLRLTINCDFDRLLELSNNHKTLRQMLGHGWLDDDHQYKLQTLKDNLKWLDMDTLSAINKVVVDGGHSLLKKRVLQRAL